MVFPLFAAIYYWVPTVSREPLSERVGWWVFGLLFVGFNAAFFPMHVTGLLGMPRRVWTYPDELGWGWLNLTSTIGAFTLGAGALLFLIDLARRFRFTQDHPAGNVWGAGTLEWLPNSSYGVRSIPIVTSREPLWDDPELEARVGEGRCLLAGAPTGGRETIVTSAIDARPEYVLQLPGPSWASFFAALFTAAAFLLLTVKLVAAALLCGAIAIAAVLIWLWDTDRGPTHEPVDVGGGLLLPVYRSGGSSHSWWAMVVLLLVAASTWGALVFSYFFLWLGSPVLWPGRGGAPTSPLAWPLASAALLAASSGAIAFASRALARASAPARIATRIALAAAAALSVAALGCELRGHWLAGLRPTQSSYGAVALCGRLHARRRATFDNTMLFWHYTVGQGLASLALVHGAARWLP
jgi:cytochrome c oxidase subunit I+III